jgi:hypothetical protein
MAQHSIATFRWLREHFGVLLYRLLLDVYKDDEEKMSCEECRFVCIKHMEMSHFAGETNLPSRIFLSFYYTTHTHRCDLTSMRTKKILPLTFYLFLVLLL